MRTINKRDLPLGDLALIVLFQTTVLLLVRSTGFAALSDDDYSRVVIAQQFVENPSWDPSGTSWLPLPFLFNGSAMRIFGATLGVARGVSWFLAVLSAITLYAASALIVESRIYRIAVTLVAVVLPYSAYTASATVPEYPSAAALVFAAASLAPLSKLSSEERAKKRVIAAIFVVIATGSRYEAWPFAAGFAAWTLKDLISAKRGGQPTATFALAFALSLAFPCLWALHGVFHHGDALFFVRRVVDYKRALGGAQVQSPQLALSYLSALVTKEPEVALGFLGGMFAFCSRPRRDLGLAWGTALLRTWSPFFLLVLVLSIGAVRGGAPTHHQERALMSLWLFAPLSLGALVTRRALTPKFCFAVLLGICLGFSLRMTHPSLRESFVDRKDEENLGRAVATSIDPSTRVAILPKDFGYFALLSAAGAPSRFDVLDRHDPRQDSGRESGAARLTAWLLEGGCFYIASAENIRKQDTVLQSSASLSLAKVSNCSRW